MASIVDPFFKPVSFKSSEFVRHPGNLPRFTLFPSTASLSPRSANSVSRSQTCFNALNRIVPLGETSPFNFS